VTDELFLSAAGDTSANFSIGPDSGRVAWAILRDLESSRSLRYEAARKESENVPLATDPFRWGLQQAARVGVHDLVLVDSFPLTTATLGFTRHTSGPPAWLTGLQTIEDRGKQLHPIYTHTVETEAWMVQLGAVAVALWLIENGVEPFAAELAGIIAAHQRDERTLKEWFIERLARIDSDLCTPEDLKLHAVVFSLLHTYSHVLLLSLATQSGLEAGSLGEVILADALGFVVYAGDTDLGAFSAAFTQMAGVVFSEVADAYASCKLDPSCSQDDGGACVGCIQLQHGCQTWNEHLSRSYLFGGPTKSEVMPDVAVGFLAMASTV
jgi:hypothetical protein